MYPYKSLRRKLILKVRILRVVKKSARVPFCRLFETEDLRFVIQIIMVIINRFINYPNVNLTLTLNTEK